MRFKRKVQRQLYSGSNWLHYYKRMQNWIHSEKQLRYKVSGSTRPCEDLFSFEVKWKQNFPAAELCHCQTCHRPPQHMRDWSTCRIGRGMLQFKKAEREGKKTGEESNVAEEIVVQWMSADVSGKQQKYTRIGPQEYVPFAHKEITRLQASDRKTSYLWRTGWRGHLAKRWPILQTEKCSIYGL